MPNSLISILIIIAMLLAAGFALGLARRSNFAPRWLFAAALIVFINDALLTNLYGLLPDLFEGSDWNWQGKLLALAATLAIAAHPAFGWRRSGLTLVQAPGSAKSAALAVLLYCLFMLGLALVFPNQEASAERIAFQLTMPGLEEEPFYRGILLLALNEAFRGRVRALGIDWGWSAMLSSALFGLAHAFSYSADGGASFDALTMALTAVPSLLVVWLRERTGSLLLPVVMHNFGNSILAMV
ncbi:CPBP family intramembrane metalloprotease [Sphingopyxis sp. DHUNG17]|uniref:CPBP family intramembrane glutamic endopeptidase, BDIM_20840 family n=1 Tax=Sphingopyxis jiangsuensis TaxID=2871171 RepID=UPI00191CCC53|nr:CPBP family intramembrane glutamic endopeptidase [Sphingopyxis lutea]MBL0767591.1 CPBP family intramembrane metalloprotease [Sphingopyxis lutea]